MTGPQSPNSPGSAGDAGAPAIGELGAAAEHRSAADAAVAHQSYDVAVRERYRAVVRGLEQHGVLEVQRARTAQQTAQEAAQTSPEAAELSSAADVFDEVVYGRRRASVADYHRIEHADRYSDAPPPQSGRPAGKAGRAERVRQRWRWRGWRLPTVGPRVWLALAAIVLVVVVFLLLPSSCAVPDFSRPDLRTPDPKPPDIHQPDPDAQPSIFETLPAPVAFGGLQLVIAGILLVCWRARRRGAIVGEPRLAEIPAHEVVAGQARLLRRSRDYAYVAGKLRAATLRRMRPALGILPSATPDLVIHALAARGVAPDLAGHALFGTCEDESMLATIAAELELIEAEVNTQ